MQTPLKLLWLTFLAAGCLGSCRAQQLSSFDPDVPGNCERAIPSPQNDSAHSPRSFQLDCGTFDMRLQTMDFAFLQMAADRAGKAQGTAFRQVMLAFVEFRTAWLQADTDGCGSGAACAAIVADDEAAFNHQFLSMTDRFKSGEMPDPTLRFGIEDLALNDAYRKSIEHEQQLCASQTDCRSVKELQQTENAWLLYREAWVSYAVLRWPSVKPDVWRAYLTRRRTEQLKQRG
jgi:uncharacterized protein YecT (DUF1311 family)